MHWRAVLHVTTCSAACSSILVGASTAHADARFSLQGRFGSATDQQDIDLTLTAPVTNADPLAFRTWSYSGTGAGTNHAGDTIPAGGFDPTLELRRAGGTVAFADNGTGIPVNFDALLSFSSGSPPLPDPLPAGDHALRLEVKDNDFSGGTHNWAVDIMEVGIESGPTPAGEDRR